MVEKPLQDNYSTVVKGQNILDARVVAQLHKNADTNVDKLSIHHTLGTAPNEASAGNHTHDGTNSAQLMAGISITGSRGGNIALGSLLSALATALGFDNNTTA